MKWLNKHSRQQFPVQFYELGDFNSLHGQEAIAIYMQSFPEEERDPLEEIAADLHKPETPEAIHHFRIMVEDGQVIGIAIFHHSGRTGWAT